MLSSGQTSTPTATTESTFSISATDFAKKLSAFFKKVRAQGGQAFLDLPRIVVIGKQSAGKSSLVEALTGISVPRDAGTCTRAPMECRLTHSADAWSCRISIRWEYDDKGNRLESIREEPFGDLIVKKEDVEPMLCRAQTKVLLGPASPADAETPVVGGRFSQNVVCVDLAGPDFPELSFVDLPGIIQHANGHGHAVNLIEDLVKSYIRGNSLILVTLSMNDDIENQKAAHFALEADPNGERTIGVLTKPDAIPIGAVKERRQWVEVISGRQHATKHGYFCTRQPDGAERENRISSADARAAEKHFFDTVEPWSTLSCRERLGTENLLKEMSRLLSQMMQKSFPKVLSDVAAQTNQCNRELGELPREVANEPCLYVSNVVSAFCADVKEHVYGSTTRTALVQKNIRTYEELRRMIASTQPPFVPCESFVTPAFDIWEFLPSHGSSQLKGPMYLDHVRAHARGSITRELPHNIPYAAKQLLFRSFQETWEERVIGCFEQVQRVFEDTLIATIDDHFGNYGNLKAAIMSIVMEHLSVHKKAAEVRIGDVVQCETRLSYTQHKGFLAAQRAQYLQSYLSALNDASLVPSPPDSESAHSSASPPRPQQVLQPEPLRFGASGQQAPNRPFDFSVMKTALASVDTVFPQPSTKTPRQAQDRPTTNGRAEGNEQRASRPYRSGDGDRLAKSYEAELELMADVRAYFDVSFQRIVDHVPMTIDLHFLYAFCESLQNGVFENLGLFGPDAKSKCHFYLAEDPTVAAKRKALKAKKASLANIQKAIGEFDL